jgi:5-methylcytosine-specific restriction endonuclease McrA
VELCRRSRDVTDSNAEIRKCKTCGLEKPLLGGFRSRTYPTGKTFFDHDCRDCKLAATKKWYEANKERVAVKNKEKYDLNREEILKYRKIHSKDPDFIKSREKWYEANADEIRAKARVKSRRWRAANPEESYLRSKVRKLKIKKIKVEKITKKQIDDLFSRQFGKCAICGEKLKEYHIDHIIPLAKGGSHEIKNLQLLHPKCNMSKQARDPIDHMQKLGFLL